MEQIRMRKENGDILELIPADELSPEQNSFRTYGTSSRVTLPKYRFLREPRHLADIDWKKHRPLAIWRDNGTYICVSGSPDQVFDERHVCCKLLHVGNCVIYGKTDAAIAETATFFLSLKHTAHTKKAATFFWFPRFSEKKGLVIYARDERLTFDFAVLCPEQLAQILDANPTRSLEIQTGVWSAEQSVILATRPYPIDLTIDQERAYNRGFFQFEEDGAAFVDAVKSRHSSFGSLDILCSGRPISLANLRNFLKLDKFEKLATSSLYGEDIILPFSANVNVRSYKVNAEHIERYITPKRFDSLNILAEDLNVTINLDLVTNWIWLMTSFLNRVAELGHLKKFRIELFWEEYFPEWSDSDEEQSDSDDELSDGDKQPDFEDVVPVAEALIRAIIGNPTLTHLTLGQYHGIFDWYPHLKGIFRALEGHKRIRTLVLEGGPSPTNIYRWLERLLKQNRYITVLDSDGDNISDGPRLRKLNALNKCYRGSASLVTEFASVRRECVMAALVGNARRNFRHTALLLSNHEDILCECIEDVNLD